MADERNRPNTHYGSFESNIRGLTTAPSEPVQGDVYYDTANNQMCIYNGQKWVCASFTTTTSTSTSTSTTTTSTSTTSTSTSTTSTSSSTTTTTSTSTSTSTSTTTTL